MLDYSCLSIAFNVPQQQDTQAFTVGRSATCQTVSHQSRSPNSRKVKSKSIQPTIEKYRKIVAMQATSKIEKHIGQSKILACQDFDRGCRSPYSM